MIDLCIVGSGDVIRDRHAAILKELSSEIRIKCIVSKRQHTFKDIQDQIDYPIQRVETLDEALELGINAALVAVTPGSTLDVATYLLRAGIPMYIEKPIGHDVIASAKLIEEINQLAVPVIIGENFQYQDRFNVARSMYEKCGHKDLTHVIVRDTLRRGIRTNPRTDDELYNEHIVHSVSSIRALTGRDIKTINRSVKRTIGSVTEYTVEGTLDNDVPVEIQVSMTNTWSEDRYSLVFKDADIRISHSYSYNTKKYTDAVEHWHGSEELVNVTYLENAACGMKKCWDEFMNILKTKSKKPSTTLINSLNDIQVREAIKLALTTAKPIPVVKFAE